MRRAPSAPVGARGPAPQQGGDGHQPASFADRRAAEASERRSQAQNQTQALFRLRVNLALEVRRPCGPDYVPSPLWQSRCGGGLKVSASHNDFPALLAEALDVLAALDADPKRAAAMLCCTPSQLIRLLKLDPRALALVNGWRRERQMHALR